MPNLMDFCEALALEGRLAQNYDEFLEETENKQAQRNLKKLITLSAEKMKILHSIVKDAPWNLKHERGIKR